MTRVSKTYGGERGYNTYVVYGNSGRIGWVRGGNAMRWQYSMETVKEGFQGFCKTRKEAVSTLERAFARKQQDGQQTPSEAPKPAEFKQQYRQGGGTPTDIVCSCGHTFRYNIRRQSAISWLQGKPCPSCAKGKSTPQSPQPEQSPSDDSTDMDDREPEPQPEPQPEPEPEPDRSEEIAALLASWPSVPDEAQHAGLTDLMLMLSAGLPVWLQGPPGTGKSTMAEQAARALGLAFHPVSCHEFMTKTDLFGYRDANGVDNRTELWEAYENGGVLLLDEVDNGNPNLLASLNSALSNGHCVFGVGTVVQKHPDFRVVATANTAGLGPESGYIGRNGVDLATRDRFVTQFVHIDANLEAALAAIALGDTDVQNDAEAISIANATEALKKRAEQAVRRTITPLELTDSITRIRNTVESRFRGTVVSPRATAHVGTMLTLGFSFNESISAKLVGLTADEVSQVI